ncbi:MAG: hypothetical protein V3U26_03285, partial [Dehalococcoidia bacterium]
MAAATEAKKKICRSCGEIAGEDYQYCTNCGSSQWGPVPPRLAKELALDRSSVAPETVLEEEYAGLGSRAKAYLIETLGANIAGLLIPFVPLGVFVTNLILYRRGRTVGA